MKVYEANIWENAFHHNRIFTSRKAAMLYILDAKYGGATEGWLRIWKSMPSGAMEIEENNPIFQ